jgi:hypothetical protein
MNLGFGRHRFFCRGTLKSFAATRLSQPDLTFAFKKKFWIKLVFIKKSLSLACPKEPTSDSRFISSEPHAKPCEYQGHKPFLEKIHISRKKMPFASNSLPNGKESARFGAKSDSFGKRLKREEAKKAGRRASEKDLEDF